MEHETHDPQAAAGRLRPRAVEQAPLAGPARGQTDAPRRRLRIAVDFDGVLFDHIPYVLRGFRDAHGIDLQAEGLRYWDFFQYRAVREKNLTWGAVRTILERIDQDTVLHDCDPRDPHAPDVIARWRAQGHEVRIVTAREPAARPSTEAFLRRNGIDHDGLVMGAFRKTGHDVLVDDAPHNVLMAAADGGLALLMDHPYNRDVPTHRNPLRVGGWLEVEACVARHLDAHADADAPRRTEAPA